MWIITETQKKWRTLGLRNPFTSSVSRANIEIVEDTTNMLKN